MELLKRLFRLWRLPVLVHLGRAHLPQLGFLGMKIYGETLDHLLCEYQEVLLHGLRVERAGLIKPLDSEPLYLLLLRLNRSLTVCERLFEQLDSMAGLHLLEVLHGQLVLDLSDVPCMGLLDGLGVVQPFEPEVRPLVLAGRLCLLKLLESFIQVQRH